jgi:hypothetical protein
MSPINLPAAAMTPPAVLPHRYPDGRTWRAACEAGDFYGLRFADGVSFDPPGLGSVAELLHHARRIFTSRRGQTARVVLHLPTSAIGANLVREIQHVTL